MTPGPSFFLHQRCRLVLLLLFAAASAQSFAARPAATTASSTARPNVLILLADDLGYSDIGCYGSEVPTPNLDRLAKNGLRFTQFYNSARCWPTRAALMTGYYAQQVRRDAFPGGPNGVRGVRPKWAPLLPALLKPHGYRSYFSGKWHIDGLPTENGFDRSYSMEPGHHFAPQRQTENDRPLPPGAADDYYSDVIADRAIGFLKEHAAQHAAQPFFGYVCFTAPHFPLQVPPGDIAPHRGRYTRGWDALRDERWQRMRALGLGGKTLSALERDVGAPYPLSRDIAKLGPGEVTLPLPWQELSPEQREFQATKMALYAAMIDRMDREIGRILEQLRTMGALENTIVLFLSDNGSSSEMLIRDHDPQAAPGSAATFLCLGPGWSSMANTPFRRHKTWVHEGGIATPLIVHWPKGIAARGELRHTPGHVIDIVPTLLELAHATAAAPSVPSASPTAADAPARSGKSLASLFAQDRAVQREAFWFLHEGNRALHAGDWKLVSTAKGEWELYNLTEDRAETRNLASENPAKVRELAAEWTRQSDTYRRWAEKDAPPEPAAKDGKKGSP